MDLQLFFNKAYEIFVRLVQLSFIAATATFMWGIISYISASQDTIIGKDKTPAKFKKAKTYMVYGVITLFIMASVWGIVALLVRTFGLGGIEIPTDITQ